MDPAAHLTANAISAYRRRRMDPAGILNLHAHVEACEECAALLADGAWADGEHLGEEEAVAFIAGITVAPGINGHLAVCAECREMVRDLRTFRTELATSPAPHVHWRYAAVAAGLFLLAAVSGWLAFRPSHPRNSPGHLVSSLQDGPRTVGLTASGELAGAGGMDASTRELLRVALQSGRLPPGPGPLEPEETTTTLRSQATPSDTFAVLAPVNMHVLSDQPVFRWQPLAGASTYEVVVFDASLKEITRSGKLRAADLKAPEWRAEKALPRGVPLRWQVAAEGGGRRLTAPRPPAGAAAFEIVSAAGAEQIERAKSVKPTSHLALAAVYARQGLLTEAANEMAQLAALNPDSRLIDSLANSIQTHGR